MLSYDVNEQLKMVAQNRCEVNKDHARIPSYILWMWLDQTEWSRNILSNTGITETDFGSAIIVVALKTVQKSVQKSFFYRLFAQKLHLNQLLDW